jgi:hypothetical protein
MTKILWLAVFLTGCGGPDFSMAVQDGDVGIAGSATTTDGAGGAPSVDADAGATGGRMAIEAAGGSLAVGGTRGSGGSPGAGGAPACALVTHDNGLGQTWQDCVPLGTHDEAQAMKACKASGATSCFLGSTVDPKCGSVIMGMIANGCNGVWGYAGATSGLARGGVPVCTCPGGSGGTDSTWK